MKTKLKTRRKTHILNSPKLKILLMLEQKEKKRKEKQNLMKRNFQFT